MNEREKRRTQRTVRTDQVKRCMTMEDEEMRQWRCPKKNWDWTDWVKDDMESLGLSLSGLLLLMQHK